MRAALMCLALWLSAAGAGELPQAMELRPLHASWIYAERWSAAQMLNAPVRAGTGEPIGHVADIIVGDDGDVHTLVVELGPLFDLREKYIGVPWLDVTLARELAHVEIPVARVRSGGYALFNRASASLPDSAPSGAWRVRALLGDFAALLDVPRYGLVEDILFSKAGNAEAVVVARGAGTWGTAGSYAYPWQGYRLQPSGALALGYRSGDSLALQQFDYRELNDVSALAGGQDSAAAGGSAPREAAPVPLFGPSKAARDKREIFQWLDSDGDAALSRSEAAWHRGLAARFDQVDQNHDGRIDVSEYARTPLVLLRQ